LPLQHGVRMLLKIFEKTASVVYTLELEEANNASLLSKPYTFE